MLSGFLLSPSFKVPAASPGPGTTHCCADVLRSTPGSARAPRSCLRRRLGHHSCCFAGWHWGTGPIPDREPLRPESTRKGRSRWSHQRPCQQLCPRWRQHGAFLLLASDGNLRQCVPQSPYSCCLLGLSSQGNPKDAMVVGSPGRSKCWVPWGLTGSRQWCWAWGYLPSPGRPWRWAPGVALHTLNSYQEQPYACAALALPCELVQDI